MSKNRMKFFKLWHGLSGSPIIGIIAKKCDENRATIMGVWVSILEFASTNRQARGTVTGVDWEVMAHQLGIEHDQFQVILGRFFEYDWIDGDKITRWPIEQPSSTERVRELRKRKAKAEAKAQPAVAPSSMNPKSPLKPRPAGYSPLGINTLK